MRNIYHVFCYWVESKGQKDDCFQSLQVQKSKYCILCKNETCGTINVQLVYHTTCKTTYLFVLIST